MEIKIDKKLYEPLKDILGKEPFDITFNNWGYKEYQFINLVKFKRNVLQELHDACSNHYNVRGIRTLQTDISNWLEASESTKAAAETRARSCSQAYRLMINYLRRFRRHHLYTRIQHGNEGITVCYYVEKVTWNHKTQYHPENFSINLVHQELGIIKKSSINYEPYECLGKSAHQLLTKEGYYIESDILRANYEEDFKHFHEIKDQIGRQYLAIGLADDEGIDGNERKESDYDGWWYSSRSSKFMLDKDGEPSKVVIDVFREKDSKKDRYDDDDETSYSESSWWSYGTRAREEDDDKIELSLKDLKKLEKNEEIDRVEIPIHPFVVAFDLKRHKRLKIHVGNLTKYEFDKKIRQKLILPEKNSALIDTLLADKETKFRDVLKGKTGGIIVLCQGKPGTGKTLTAEVYAESLERALYTIQCSQLGTDPEELESNLLKVLARGRRWGAVMLLDEADVYVHTRGSDLQQNAIVGVFLRVLEYHSGTLFLTTNRGDLVDDAILSRCTARIPYDIPDPDHQELIWQVLAEANEVGDRLTPGKIKKIVQAHPKLSGRDCKNLLKLAIMVSKGQAIDVDLITEMKQFKPTEDAE